MLIDSYFCVINVIYAAMEPDWIVILNIFFENNIFNNFSWFKGVLQFV
jgi:hypothetical protein